MSAKRRAAVVDAAGTPLVMRPLRLRPPRVDELRVRLVACGICHTDLDMCASAAAGSILGHEGAGIVEQTGSAVRAVQPGDAVLLSYQSCGRCASCRQQRPAHCDNFWQLNFDFQRLDGSSGYLAPLHGHFFGQSSFASHALVSERNVVRVANTLPLATLAPLGCGLQTGAGTVLNSLNLQRGERLLVLGVGTVGLAAVMAARLRRATSIVALDSQARRLRLASELGATQTLQTAQRLQQLAPLDYVIDTTGNAALEKQALDRLRPGGTLVRLTGGGAMKLSHHRQIISVIQGDAVPQRFIPYLIAQWQAGHFPFDRLIDFYPFEAINQALAAARSGESIKAVLRFA
ncbi:NAD(P)-dependent alcohol dehydrogenase [Serratia odorifera]|uniref:Aryl-alcohol dehydrogenase n=1 Tax=Serratia odorifera TaxID=618 RepID=A0A447L2B1_SEROD|nr:NAD(P)-dependent alcohol dehydrogenase [Serratia odorifera]PNK88582.1 NAD(P)-dependent alcohol dehydrogenase [Serratia odorifera]RII69623.1 NAD(P)-dependent alcohol dehydrogenase [Serratia odorifera]VDZ65467.1 Aryl-alcohol dehydrogenase [Serratia odorifera]